jgi:hypothetical protein
MNLELNPENINNNNSSISNRVSCCSFCRMPGHRITSCHDERIDNFETVMMYQLKNIINVARTYNTSFCTVIHFYYMEHL